MWTELISKIDEMWGASLLTGIAATSMYLGIDGGVVEMCVTGIVALLMAKTVKAAK